MRIRATKSEQAPDEVAGRVLHATAERECLGARARGLARQAACLAFTTAVHLGMGALLIHQWSTSFPASAPEPPPIMAIDLAPLPPSPPEPEAQPVPRESMRRMSSVDPAPQPDPVLRHTAPLDRIDAPVVLPAPVPIRHDAFHLEDTPPPPLPSRERDGEPSFEGLLLARLEQVRRYPSDAQRRGEEGVVQLRFRMNREGRVLESAIVRGSGCRSLDREALATLRRAQPLPRIPDDRPETLEVAVPIEFFFKHI